MTRRPPSATTATLVASNGDVVGALARALTNMLMAHGACEEREIELRARVSEWDFYRLYAKLAALVEHDAFAHSSAYQHRGVLSAGDLRTEHCFATQRDLGSHRKQRLAHVDFALPWSESRQTPPPATGLRLAVASEFPACDARVADTAAAYRREKLRLSLRIDSLAPRWRVDFTITASPAIGAVEYEVEIEFLHDVVVQPTPSAVDGSSSSNGGEASLVYESVEQLVAQALSVCRVLEFVE